MLHTLSTTPNYNRNSGEFMVPDVMKIWKELSQVAASAEGFECRRILPNAACDIFVAIRKPENIPCLLLEIKSTSIEPEMVYPESKGFLVWPSAIEHGAQGRIRLVLEMRNSRFDKIFSVLVTDVMDALAEEKDEKKCIHEMINRLILWQTFLEKCGPDGLNEIDQQGLYGELFFLRTILLNHIPLSKAVNSWVGPSGANQDFIIGTDAIEVKTSIAASPKSIHISNIRQLDTRNIGRLLLAFLALDKRPGNERTLPLLIDGIRSLLVDDINALNTFDERLREAGYIDFHREMYNRTSYTPRYQNYYRVENDFPRLLEGSLPNGVEDVKYSITIAACSPYRIQETQLIEIIKDGHQ